MPCPHVQQLFTSLSILHESYKGRARRQRQPWLGALKTQNQISWTSLEYSPQCGALVRAATDVLLWQCIPVAQLQRICSSLDGHEVALWVACGTADGSVQP